MRAPLKIALAVAVLGAGWAATQQDDGVELAASDKRGASASRGRDSGKDGGKDAAPSRRPAGGDRRASGVARAPSGVDAAAVPWTDAALSEGVQAWRLRLAEVEALPPARPMTTSSPSAWASMAPPPPPPVKEAPPPPPPPPMAPRFPHAWIGRVNDETVSVAASPAAVAPAVSSASAASAPRPIQRAVLAGPVSTWVVKDGDVIEGQWRVDRIQDRTMRLTYLPLQQSQTVSMK